MTEQAICHFDRLPLEMIYEILHLIPFREKKNARLVCNVWRMVIDSFRPVVFRPVLTNNTSMKYFLQSYRSMDKVIMQNINKRKSKNPFGNSEFPRVKNAVLGWKNSAGNIERFLTQGCEYAESLELFEFSLDRISRGAISKTLSEINWKNLTRFKVMTSSLYTYNDTRVRKHLRNLTTVLKYARIPTLKELDFFFNFCFGVVRKILQCQKLFMGLYVFLVAHSKTLKMLTGRIYTNCKYTLEIPEIPKDLEQSLLTNMKLEHFGLSILCSEIRRYDSMFNPALFGTELKNLDIKIKKPHTRNTLLLTSSNLFGRNLQLIFERNGETLTNVSLYLPVDLTPENRGISATWITESMRNLETITILGPYIDIQVVQTLLTLPKLKRIAFSSETWDNFPQNVFEQLSKRSIHVTVGRW